jgi:lipid-binding SYLF domain-containing protein
MTVAVAVAVAALGVTRLVRADDDKLVAQANQTLAQFQSVDPGLSRFVKGSAGYAVFPTITKGGLVVGAAHGKGVLYVNGKPVGRTGVTHATIGAQAGGQEFSEVIFFETPQALAQFKNGEFTVSAQASAVALKEGAAAGARFQQGVAIFTATKGGLMLEASVGGQKFSFEPFYSGK